jgi:hypothetical protein
LRRTLIGAALATLFAAGLAGTPAPAEAQADVFPSRMITLVAPFPPGRRHRRADAQGRREAAAAARPERHRREPRRRRRHDRRAHVAKAPPDGHTLLMGVTGTNAISGSLYKKLPFDPRDGVRARCR